MTRFHDTFKSSHPVKVAGMSSSRSDEACEGGGGMAIAEVLLAIWPLPLAAVDWKCRWEALALRDGQGGIWEVARFLRLRVLFPARPGLRDGVVHVTRMEHLRRLRHVVLVKCGRAMGEPPERIPFRVTTYSSDGAYAGTRSS